MSGRGSKSSLSVFFFAFEVSEEILGQTIGMVAGPAEQRIENREREVGIDVDTQMEMYSLPVTLLI